MHDTRLESCSTMRCIACAGAGLAPTPAVSMLVDAALELVENGEIPLAELLNLV